MLAFTTPDIISTSPKKFLTSRIDFTVLLIFEFLKKHRLPVGQVKNRIHQAWEFTSPIAKSASTGLSDTTSFAHCGHKYQMYKLLNLPRTTISTEYTCFTRGSSVLLLPNSQQNSKFYHNQLGENRNLNKFASRILWLPD